MEVALQSNGRALNDAQFNLRMARERAIERREMLNGMRHYYRQTIAARVRRYFTNFFNPKAVVSVTNCHRRVDAPSHRQHSLISTLRCAPAGQTRSGT